jgi:hypothetical protein
VQEEGRLAQNTTLQQISGEIGTMGVQTSARSVGAALNQTCEQTNHINIH